MSVPEETLTTHDIRALQVATAKARHISIPEILLRFNVSLSTYKRDIQRSRELLQGDLKDTAADLLELNDEILTEAWKQYESYLKKSESESDPKLRIYYEGKADGALFLLGSIYGKRVDAVKSAISTKESVTMIPTDKGPAVQFVRQTLSGKDRALEILKQRQKEQETKTQ